MPTVRREGRQTVHLGANWCKTLHMVAGAASSFIARTHPRPGSFGERRADDVTPFAAGCIRVHSAGVVCQECETIDESPPA